MLKKLKKLMVVAAAAVMLSAGFATVAPNEAHAAHWADIQMKWAFKKGIVTADLRDNLATRQDTWIMIARWLGRSPSNYDQARKFVVDWRISDGTRGTDLVTRDEVVAMLHNRYMHGHISGWTPSGGFSNARDWGVSQGIYDGSRGNAFATRAEVVTMLFNI
ncbi:TPA: protein phosphatase 2C [Bacillus cereus]